MSGAMIALQHGSQRGIRAGPAPQRGRTCEKLERESALESMAQACCRNGFASSKLS